MVKRVLCSLQCVPPAKTLSTANRHGRANGSLAAEKPDLPKILLHEMDTLRQELRHLKDCQVRYFLLSLVASITAFGLASRADNHTPQLYLAPLVVILPCWWTFFDKASSITRIVGYYRILEQIVLQKDRHQYLGWESSLAAFRDQQERGLLKYVPVETPSSFAKARNALNVLDPDNKLLRELMVFQTRPAGRGGGVRATFEQGVEQVRQLIERNPDIDFAWLHPDLAESLLESKLVAFEPDAWLDRVAELEPIRTAAEGPSLPIGVRLRLRELFKVYTFGCWFAAVSAARATLEYALLENSLRFSVSLPVSRHAGQSPSLYKLIQAFAPHTPD